jgi:hypothetical protein
MKILALVASPRKGGNTDMTMEDKKRIGHSAYPSERSSKNIVIFM